MATPPPVMNPTISAIIVAIIVIMLSTSLKLRTLPDVVAVLLLDGLPSFYWLKLSRPTAPNIINRVWNGVCTIPTYRIVAFV